MDHNKDGRRLLTLTRDNYARWIIEVEDVLRSKSLWSHVTGRVTVVAEPNEDEDSKLFDAWDSKDSKARSIIPWFAGRSNVQPRARLQDIEADHRQDPRITRAEDNGCIDDVTDRVLCHRMERR